MNPIDIIEKYYDKNSKLYNILIEHGLAVAKKSIDFAEKVKHLNPDLKFIEEAAMLHDIGIFLTHAPKIECFGNEPYIRHGYLGKQILEKEGFYKHALVCERHLGFGLSAQDIKLQNLPLPQEDILPISIEEQIICFADNFFSKENPNKEKSIDMVKSLSLKYNGKNHFNNFNKWSEMFL